MNRDARVAGGKIGGRVVVAKYGPTALGERMRAGLLNKYLRQVDEAAHLVGCRDLGRGAPAARGGVEAGALGEGAEGAAGQGAAAP